MLTTLKFNLANAAIRHETLQGRRYVVAPMVMLTEGVHSGSGGPLLYKAEEIKRAAPGWNMKPIVVYHPQINGEGVSACDPDILEAQQVGMVMNAKWNGKLRAEAWIDEDRAGKVDARVTKALEENKLMEVSTGLFTDNVGEEGEWKGEKYKAVAINHQPDHLALLPDQIGACSIADGAGLLQLNETAQDAGIDVGRLLAYQMDVLRRMVGNAMSHADLSSALQRALTERFKPGKDVYIWVADVFDDFVVYEISGNGKGALYKLPYISGKDAVVLSKDEPVEVVRVTRYEDKPANFMGNAAMTKTEGGSEYPAAAFAYVPDPEKPSTWKLRLWETADKGETAAQVGRAVAAIGAGFRGQKVQLPASAVKGVKAKIKAAWKRVNPNKKDSDIPAVLNERSMDNMEKEKIVDALIANKQTAWGEADREVLLAMDDTVLEKMAPVANTEKEPEPAAPVTNAQPAVPAPTAQTVQQYVDNAPPEIRELLTNGLAVHEEEKAKLIDGIVANKSNKFTKEFLATKGLQELRGLAALAGANEPPTNSAPAMFYGGAATPPSAPVVNADDGGLALPVINFEKEKAAAE